jgi:hypothetical protein
MQSYSSQYPDYSADNNFEYGRRSTERPVRTRRSGTARSASRKSTGYGGVHRRRNKQWSW